MPPWRHYARLRLNAAHAHCGKEELKPSLVLEAGKPKLCLLASSLDSTRTSPANLLSAPRKLLNKVLLEAGIAREEVYVTNVVKHFKWEPKGQQHIHKKPNAKE